MHIKTLEEINLIKSSSILVSKTLGMLTNEIKPGISTLYLDSLAETFIRDNGGIPAFLGLYNYPNTICASINEQIIHGIPTKIPLKDGEIVSIDCGVKMNNYYGEHAYTFEVGNVNSNIRKLLKISKESLYLGIAECKAGNHIGDIGYAIQNHVEKHGYSIVREFGGHGLGKKIHEEPNVPNYGIKQMGKKLLNGLVLAIEPIVNKGKKYIKINKDGWTISTLDKKPSAHYEHNIAIINGKPYLLSTYKYIYDSLGISSKEEKFI
ncbi:MAG: type I methionyl aminopeptidase [Candidatus Karelsulcia muelleri]|uniref:type I methionyl aminopeptidase n=1 Tax=Candidatus Karelsulcia muelleri TaxID=336810 RepID=UPI000D7C634B|nr:type I methionyl aminopeptidase [Candidatus Karelsulcia muelleri]